MGDAFAGLQEDAVDFGVLMDGGGVFASVRRNHEDFGVGVVQHGILLSIVGSLRAAGGRSEARGDYKKNGGEKQVPTPL